MFGISIWIKFELSVKCFKYIRYRIGLYFVEIYLRVVFVVVKSVKFFVRVFLKIFFVKLGDVCWVNMLEVVFFVSCYFFFDKIFV